MAQHSEDSYVDVNGSSTTSSNDSNPIQSTLRPLSLTSSRTQVDIPVSAQPYQAWITAEVLRDEFKRSLEKDAHLEIDLVNAQDDGQDEDEESSSDSIKAAQLQAQLEAKVVLTSKFLGFLSSKISVSSPSSASSIYPILESTWIYFSNNFLDSTDVHKLVSTLDTQARSSVLRSYYEALVSLSNQGKGKPSASPKTPKLLELASSGQAEIYALFGGQGNNEVSLQKSFGVEYALGQCVC